MSLIFTLCYVLYISASIIPFAAPAAAAVTASPDGYGINVNHFTYHSNVSSNKGSIAEANSKCDASLWKFIPTPGRLKVVNPCMSITGIVDVIRLHPPDGDTNLGIKLDSQYRALLTKANFSNKLIRGDMWIEMICQHKNTSDSPVKKGGCKGYNGPHFIVPKKGQHVNVTGSYVLDVREGGHAEIHPVSSIKVIK
jgi:hypothetical protein